MTPSSDKRYDDVAVIFHWLIALMIIGLLIVGKLMTSFDDEHPMRYQLTQWHKSFGIVVLLLSLLRLMWRLFHRPPPELESIPGWQQRAAAATHSLLYLLMLVIPITGWIMVSASPLNLDTVLFNVIEWPHLPPFDTLENREQIARSFHDHHELAANAIILLLLAHVGAAIKHHLIDKDVTLLRMMPPRQSATFRRKTMALAALIAASTGALLWAANLNRGAAVLAAGPSEVSFVADVAGEQTTGAFTTSSVEALIDENDLAGSSLNARVQTASVTSSNFQVAGSLPEPEWFGAEAYPEALFQSTTISATAEGLLKVVGVLTIKQTTQDIEFTMQLLDEEDKRIALGEFPIDRREFDIGMESQANDDIVGFEVWVKFRFDISPNDA